MPAPSAAERAAAKLQSTFRRNRRYARQLEESANTTEPAHVELLPGTSLTTEPPPAGPPAEPTCYVCGSADEDFDIDGQPTFGLMVCRQYATCGGAKHASCCGIKAAVANWTCEPCKGRPKQKYGEKMDWSADLAAQRSIDDEFDRYRAGGLACCVANICLCTVQ